MSYQQLEAFLPRIGAGREVTLKLTVLSKLWPKNLVLVDEEHQALLELKLSLVQSLPKDTILTERAIEAAEAFHLTSTLAARPQQNHANYLRWQRERILA